MLETGCVVFLLEGVAEQRAIQTQTEQVQGLPKRIIVRHGHVLKPEHARVDEKPRGGASLKCEKMLDWSVGG